MAQTLVGLMVHLISQSSTCGLLARKLYAAPVEVARARGARAHRAGTRALKQKVGQAVSI